jgi:hypothetical protein
MGIRTGFLPSKHGLAYTNSWPSQPAVVRQTPFGAITLGNAARGLCGGMVFAALDYWHAGVLPPERRPAAGTAAYTHIVDRLVDSWHIPAGVAQYYQWMNLPDADTGFDVLGRHVLVERGLAWRTITVQWRQVRTDLDHGTPVALGVVTVDSADPRDLGLNHQVLAYGYDLDGSNVTLNVYDPNRGRRDDAAIRFDTRNPQRRTTFSHTLGLNRPLRGFFRTAYQAATPPPPTPG